MQNRSNRSLLALILLVTVSQLSHLLRGGLIPEALQWQAHDAEMHLNLVLVIVYCIYITSYRELDKKCVLFAWLGFEAVSLFQSIILVKWQLIWQTY